MAKSKNDRPANGTGDGKGKRKWPGYASLRLFLTSSSWKTGLQVADTLIPYLLLWAAMLWIIKADQFLW